MSAARHQRLDAAPELLHAEHEIVEGRDPSCSAVGRPPPNDDFSSLADKRCLGVEAVRRLGSRA
jgi:hypothetical protein